LRWAVRNMQTSRVPGSTTKSSVDKSGRPIYS
jgi:hypothetical protein